MLGAGLNAVCGHKTLCSIPPLKLVRILPFQNDRKGRKIARIDKHLLYYHVNDIPVTALANIRQEKLTELAIRLQRIWRSVCRGTVQGIGLHRAGEVRPVRNCGENTSR